MQGAQFSILLILDFATDLDDLKKKIESKILALEDGSFKCSDCDYVTKFRHNLPKHIETRHVSLSGLVCHVCLKVCPTRESHRRHLQRHTEKLETI